MDGSRMFRTLARPSCYLTKSTLMGGLLADLRSAADSCRMTG